MGEYFESFFLLSFGFGVFSSICILIMSCFLTFSSVLSNYYSKVLLLGSFSMVLTSLSFCFNSNSYTGCQVQASLLTFGCLSALSFSNAIFYSLYQDIIKDQKPKINTYIIPCYLLPALISGYLYSIQSYGQISFFCFVSPSNLELFYSILILFIPVLFSYFFCFNLSLKISLFLKEFESGYFPEEFREKEENFKNFKTYAWVLNFAILGFMACNAGYWKSSLGSNLLLDILLLLSCPLIGYYYAMCLLFKIFGKKEGRKKVIDDHSTIFLECSLNPSAITTSSHK